MNYFLETKFLKLKSIIFDLNFIIKQPCEIINILFIVRVRSESIIKNIKKVQLNQFLNMHLFYLL